MSYNTMKQQAAGWQQQKPEKSYLVALLLSIFVGGLGVDRFYLGHITMGILKLVLNFFITIITFGLGGWIWWLIDLILIATKKVNSDDFVWDDERPTPVQPYDPQPGQAPQQPGYAPQQPGFTHSPYGNASPYDQQQQYAQSQAPYGQGFTPHQAPPAPHGDGSGQQDEPQSGVSQDEHGAPEQKSPYQNYAEQAKKSKQQPFDQEAPVVQPEAPLQESVLAPEISTPPAPDKPVNETAHTVNNVAASEQAPPAPEEPNTADTSDTESTSDTEQK